MTPSFQREAACGLRVCAGFICSQTSTGTITHRTPGDTAKNAKGGSRYRKTLRFCQAAAIVCFVSNFWLGSCLRNDLIEFTHVPVHATVYLLLVLPWVAHRVHGDRAGVCPLSPRNLLLLPRPAVAVACMLGARMFPSGAGPCLPPATIARFPLSPLFARAESVSYPEQRALALTATSKIGCAR